MNAEKVINKEINFNCLKYFYTLESYNNKGYTFKNLLSGELVDLKHVRLPKRASRYYFIIQNRLMTQKEKKNLCVNYKIESFFHKRLGSEGYKKVIESLNHQFLNDFLRLSDRQMFIEKQMALDSELTQKFKEVINLYLNRKKKKLPRGFYFLSKDHLAVDFLNKICKLVNVKKNNYHYELVDCENDTFLKIKEMLEQYKINIKNTDYMFI